MICLIWVSGVVAVLLSKESENGARFIVLLSILNPDGYLAVVEFTSSFANCKLLEGYNFIFVLNFSVGQKDSDLFATSVELEVN